MLIISLGKLAGYAKKFVLTVSISDLIRLISFLLMGFPGYAAIAPSAIVSKTFKKISLLHQLRNYLNLQFFAGSVQTGKLRGTEFDLFLPETFLIFGLSFRTNTSTRGIFLTEDFALPSTSFAGVLHFVLFSRLRG